MEKYVEPTNKKPVAFSDVCGVLNSGGGRRDDGDRIIDWCLGSAVTILFEFLVYILSAIMLR